ncbi:MAG: cupredoxin domain-containing protein [Proteobacteria bacterium]|nr:cupredoxin domain-containing protein [Pseudomonadota bacterium]
MKIIALVGSLLAMSMASQVIFAEATKPAAPSAAKVPHTTINLEAKMVDGKKTWTPTSVTAPKGQVLFHLTNSLPEPHGFSIPGILKVPAVVAPGQPMDVLVQFEKAGPIDLVCHLHPAHVKSTLTVK